MLNLRPGKLFLTLLLASVLAGLSACGAPPLGGEPPDPGAQPTQNLTQSQPENAAQVESTDSHDCTDGEPHPIGQSIAATYEASYEQVMTWFCSGYSFENILIALETSEAVEVPADMLLQMLLEKDWEEIWVEVGFTGSR